MGHGGGSQPHAGRAVKQQHGLGQTEIWTRLFTLPQGRVSILEIMANPHTPCLVYNTVFFTLKVKNKPHKEAMNVCLCKGLLAWLRTMVLDVIQ
jgi:hypothetical protein